MRGDTLLYVGQLSASFNLFKLKDQQLLITGVDLDDFVININKDSVDSDFNFQFLIDAFASDTPDEPSSSSMAIEIHDVSLRKGRIAYDILSEPALGENEFDFNHIHLYDIQADLNVNSIDIENLDVALTDFKLKERSGFEISRIELAVNSQGKKINLNDLQINLPNSTLAVFHLAIDYSGFKLSELMDAGSFHLTLGDNELATEDIKMFYPPLASLKERITFSGNMSAPLPHIYIHSLTAAYGEGIRLDMDANLYNYLQWENTSMQLNLKELSATSRSIDEVLAFVTGDKSMKMPVNTGDILLTGSLRGNLPDLTLEMTGTTDRGAINLEGSGGYVVSSGAAHFQADLDMQDFDIHTLMRDSLYGTATLHMNAQGNLNSKGILNAGAVVDINRFDYNGYSYHSIQGEGSIAGDTVRFQLDSDDSNIPLQAIASANIGKKNPKADLSLRIDSIYIDTLNFIEGYRDAYLSATIRADVQGFDPEQMHFNLAIDSFFVHSDKGSFNDPKLRLSYRSESNGKKAFNLSSRLIRGKAEGAFTYAGIQESLMEAFPVLFEGIKRKPKKKDPYDQNLGFRFDVQDANSLTQLLQIGSEIPDSAIFIGQYSNRDENLELLLSAYTQYFEADTLQVSMLASNRDNNLSLILNLDNKSKLYDVDGSIDAEVEFIPVRGSIPDMNIALNPSVFVVNDTYFDMHEAKVEVREKRYSVQDFMFSHGEDEYIRVDGIVSELPEDSIRVKVNKFEIGTLLGAMKTTDIPISFNANGDIVAKQLLTQPLVLTRKFGLNNIVFAGNDIGDANIMTAYSTERQGIVLRATLDHKDRQQSLISGFYLPEKDSLSATAKIRDIRLAWLGNMAEGMLYGLDGSLNADMKVNGSVTTPHIDGYAYFDKARFGVSMLNTLYATSDSIFVNSKEVSLRRFRIVDENNQSLTANGKVSYQNFANFSPNISLSMNNFMVMNNQNQTDSLFYGNLKLNGRLTITENNREWQLSGDISHADKSSIMINIPTGTGTTAQRHSSITFINSLGEDLDALEKEQKRLEATQFSFPMRINIALALNEGLTMGAVYNPVTGDSGKVTGSGLITFNYDLASQLMALGGDYTIKTGKATLSIANITKKTFTVQEGGKLTFRGDPLATQFDITALYNLRADMSTLDSGFDLIMGGNTRVPVTCSISVKGDLDQMDIAYDITLPDESEEITRRFENLLYNHDDKIIQIAYLLAMGNFMPLDNSPINSDNMLGSLASSGINAIFSGILNDNWAINTNINAASGTLDEMDVNISTNLLNNRLTVTSTLGYSNDAMFGENITGDFNVEYKLIPSGNLILRAYNVTNNKYFDKAPYTQGVGIMYRRSEKTFEELFEKIKKRVAARSGRRSGQQRSKPEATESSTENKDNTNTGQTEKDEK